ncbi:hypothetical protein [Saccharopolyspora griseoalba]|uniref:Uncharacterized protein n=1 Tax=Saccharopolyspora griseoalba TaxID=1431848 RepID=A0ABW2LMJ8_9PSEU
MTAVELNRSGDALAIAARCPLCGWEPAWAPAPLERWYCPDCEVSWRDERGPGLRERPIRVDGRESTEAPSLLGEFQR